MPHADPPAAERVYATTKEDILSGQLAGGTLLSEAEVAKRMQVSRTPAREAFVRLAAEGLLSLLPRRGAVVTPLSATEAVDLLEVRHALESAAVQRLARIEDAGERAKRLSPARAAIGDQLAHLANDDTEGFVVADERFHLGLVLASGNELAGRFYGTLGDRQRRMIAQAISVNTARLAELPPEHQVLLDLAQAANVEGFDAALWNHLRRTHAVLAGAHAL